jgi:hypothetical protein
MTNSNIKNAPYLIVCMMLITTLAGCFANPQASGFKSVFTSIKDCQSHIDSNDPNSTSYKLCPGVAGYQLILRKMGAGRKSIEVINAAQQSFPLNYQDLVTKGMFHLGQQAEWRVVESSNEATPVALVVEVHAHENLDEPDQVTTTYLAVAKISATEICVIDVVDQQDLSRQQLQQLADDAQQRACLNTPPNSSAADHQ